MHAIQSEDYLAKHKKRFAIPRNVKDQTADFFYLYNRVYL